MGSNTTSLSSSGIPGPSSSTATRTWPPRLATLTSTACPAWLTLHAFETSLRNVELTAPYAHNGTIATLEEVVDVYSVGVSVHPSITDIEIGPRQ